MVSLQKKQAQIAAIEVKESFNVPAVKRKRAEGSVINDLTVLSQSELCDLMRRPVDKMTADYAVVERITAEAQRRESTENHGSEDYWGNVDYFQFGLAEKIICGNKCYKKCNRNRRKVVFIFASGEKAPQTGVCDAKEYPNDLTALTQMELSGLMREVTDKMASSYELVKRSGEQLRIAMTAMTVLNILISFIMFLPRKSLTVISSIKNDTDLKTGSILRLLL